MIANARFNTAKAITASDAVDFTAAGLRRILTDAIYVGTAGVVPVVFEDGTVVNFTAPAGAVLPVAARRVNATNLTAGQLVGLYAL